MTEAVPGPPLVCDCGHNITVHWPGEGCKKCECPGYRRGATSADWARVLAAVSKSTQPDRVAAVVSLLVTERRTVASRFLGLVDAWEHVAAVNASAATGSYDDATGKALAHAAAAVRRAAEVNL